MDLHNFWSWGSHANSTLKKSGHAVPSTLTTVAVFVERVLMLLQRAECVGFKAVDQLGAAGVC